jgi:hypothetical protein
MMCCKKFSRLLLVVLMKSGRLYSSRSLSDLAVVTDDFVTLLPAERRIGED